MTARATDTALLPVRGKFDQKQGSQESNTGQKEKSKKQKQAWDGARRVEDVANVTSSPHLLRKGTDGAQAIGRGLMSAGCRF